MSVRIVSCCAGLFFALVGCASRVKTPAEPAAATPVEPADSTEVNAPLELDFIKVEQAFNIPKGAPLLHAYFKGGRPSWMVPVWLDYEQDGVRCEGVRVDSFEIPGDRLFVGQHLGVLCESPVSAYSLCKARRLHSKSQWEEIPCPDLTTGYNVILEPLGDDVFASSSSMEGGTDIAIFRWEQDDTYTPLLTYITHGVSKNSDTGEIMIESACHPLTGRSMRRYDPSLCQRDGPECSYCDMMYGKALTWTWSPGEEPVVRR